jgi:hypothetical protein
LISQRKKAAGKLDLAARLRRETTMPLKWIAARVHLGTSWSANGKLHQWMKNQSLHPPPTGADAPTLPDHDDRDYAEQFQERVLG